MRRRLGLGDDEALGLLDDRVLSSPIPSISTRTTSPTFSSPSGNGWRTAPMPAGVPVAITSPGSSVNA